MKMHSLNWNKILGGALAFFFCVAIQVHAGGGFGGGGGGGGGGGRGGGGGGGGFGGGGFGGGGFGAAATGGGNTANAARTTTSTSTYNNNGTVGVASIAVDPDTHNLIISADAVTMAQIKQVLNQLDNPEPQVQIKVVFLEIALNNSSEIGVQGSYSGFNSAFNQITGYVTNYAVVNNAIVPTSITPVRNSTIGTQNFGGPASLPGTSGTGGLYSLVGNDFTATLQAIAAAGKSTVLSRPEILARDGQPAQIVVGQEIYLPSGVTYTTAGNGGATIPQINGSYQNVGIILNVTPFIGENSLVTMILAPQISELDTSTPGQVISYGSSLVGSSPVYAPNINIRSANTVAVTPDGQTVVIGGLISNAKSTGETKIPLLGDIPLLGSLFKASTKNTVKQELVIFLTPHIIAAPAQLAMMTGAANQPSYITNSVSEQELNQFLEKVPVKKN